MLWWKESFVIVIKHAIKIKYKGRLAPNSTQKMVVYNKKQNIKIKFQNIAHYYLNLINNDSKKMKASILIFTCS